MNYSITLILLLILWFTSQTNTCVAENRSPVTPKEPGPEEPFILFHFDEMPRVLTLPDGRLIAVFIRHKGPGLPAAKDFQDVRARYSDNNGESWSKEEVLFRLPKEAGGFGYFVGLVDNDGEIHLYMLNDRATGRILPLPEGLVSKPVTIDSPLDIWHVRSREKRTKWETPKEIYHGRAGDLQSVIQLKNGRIILPFSYLTNRNWANRGTGPDIFTYTGRFNCGALYSDDGGSTWIESPDILKTPTPNLSAYGPVEPVVVELNDGTIWMLLRTQMGRFYESFSENGSVWSSPKPNSILSSDSPAGFVRLTNGQLLMFVNSCQRFPYANGGRHVLHAAVSEDEGKTWKGYREILRDPQQEFGPPPNGDNGVSYPYPTLTKDGKIVFSLWVDGTKQGRNLYRFDPKWLLETAQNEDFSSGLKNWSVFGTKGVELVTAETGSQILSVRKSYPEWPSGAVLNFPSGQKGELMMRIMLKKEFGGVLIGLTDHFSVPFDKEAEFYNLFNLEIDKDGMLAGTKTQMEQGIWDDLVLKWDCLQYSCKVLLNEVQVTNLIMQHNNPAVSYLRLNSVADVVDQGLFIEYVKSKVTK